MLQCLRCLSASLSRCVCLRVTVVEVSDLATDVTSSSFIASMESRLAAVYSHAMSLDDHGQPRSRHRRARSQHNATIQVNQAHISYQIFSSDLKSSRNYCCSRRRSQVGRAMVKLLSKSWWIPAGATPKGPRAEVGFSTADHGFSSIQGTLFDFYGI